MVSGIQLARLLSGGTRIHFRYPADVFFLYEVGRQLSKNERQGDLCEDRGRTSGNKL